MRECDEERFVDDLLDVIPAAPRSLLPEVYEEALSRYAKFLEAKRYSGGTLSEFVVIHHSLTYFLRGRWGEDSALDDGQLPAQVYHWDKFKQIASSKLGLADSFVESAIQDILSRHGFEGAIRFINRAWTEKMIVSDHQAWLPWWFLARSMAFGIDYHESRAEYHQASTSARASRPIGDGVTVSMYEVAGEIAKIDTMKRRDRSKLIEYYWSARSTSESALAEVRRVHTISSWMKGIRNLLPAYVMLNVLADEAHLGAKTQEERSDLLPLSRFVDERKADIKTCLLFPSCNNVLDEIASGEDQRSQIRKVGFYEKGRVLFPSFVSEKLIKMVRDGMLTSFP